MCIDIKCLNFHEPNKNNIMFLHGFLCHKKSNIVTPADGHGHAEL